MFWWFICNLIGLMGTYQIIYFEIDSYFSIMFVSISREKIMFKYMYINYNLRCSKPEFWILFRKVECLSLSLSLLHDTLYPGLKRKQTIGAEFDPNIEVIILINFWRFVKLIGLYTRVSSRYFVAIFFTIFTFLLSNLDLCI